MRLRRLRLWGSYELGPNGKETVLHAFTGSPDDGEGPQAGLLRDRAGHFYGTTMIGGTSDRGTVFKMDRRGRLRLLHSFMNTDGLWPSSTLVQGTDGSLYGTTQAGGDLSCDNGYGCGVVFRITP